MKRLNGLILILALALPLGTLATDATWVNNGTIVTAPMIDATNVINLPGATIDIFTTQPFDTSNTRNFTNGGTMTGSVGWRFDYAPRNSSGQSIGTRRLAQNFHNRVGATIGATDGFLLSGFTGSYLYVHATNIINQGIMGVGAGGVMQFVGTNVDLSRSGMQVESIAPVGAAVVGTNYFPSVAIYDMYWGQTNADYITSGIINFAGQNLVVISPPHQVTDGANVGNVQIGIQNPFVAAYTNLVASTNISVTNDVGEVEVVVVPTSITRQAVFVGVSNPTNFSAAVRFQPSTQITNRMRTVAVEISMVESNVVTAQNQLNYVYFMDTLASETNRGGYINVSDGTVIPANYLISRGPAVQWGNRIIDLSSGAPGNATLTNDFLYGPDFGSPIVQDQPYAGYQALVDNLTSVLPSIPGATVTNQPGRLEINAYNLDLNKTRLRAMGYLTIQANHLVSSSNAVVDCQNLNFDLASTNGVLRIQNLAKESVTRMRGNVYAWSGLWTNTITQIITNYDASTNPVVYAPITNVISVGLHTLILNANTLLDSIPVTIYDLKAKATNVVMSDSGIVAQKLFIDGPSFTLSGRLTLTGVNPAWNYTNAPTLRYFTNTGTLNVDSEANFGGAGPLNYLGFVNRGTIQSQGQTINSDYAELGGTNIAGASLALTTIDGKVESGRVVSSGDSFFWAGSLKLNRSLISSQSRIYLSVTNALLDNGAASSNTLTTGDGFFLTRKPATGDLLGTKFQSTAPGFAMVTHLWAGRDDGVSPAGFANNVAMGTLALIPQGSDPLFVFSGTGTDNGLYTDVLDLSQLLDYSSQLQVDPNLTIYYAAAKLSFTPPVGQSPEEYLNGQLGGRLRWVPGFAGPNSSVDVIINGNQTIKVNKALRNSSVIDSDADGVPNFFDLSPFDGVVINSISQNVTPPGYLLKWTAAPNTVYAVEYKTNLAQVGWSQLLMTTNTASTNAAWSALDTNVVPSKEQRYYRVIYNPNGP